MFGANAVLLVGVGVVLVGLRSGNFVLRGVSNVLFGVAVMAGLVYWVGHGVAVEVTAPSALHGMVPPEPASAPARQSLGRQRLYDLGG